MALTKQVDGVTIELTAEEEKALREEWAKNLEQAKEEHRQILIEQNLPSVYQMFDILWQAMDSGSLSKDNDFYRKIKEVKDKFKE